jgi:hypothetical protein
MSNAYAWACKSLYATTQQQRRDRLADLAMVALIREIKPTEWTMDDVEMSVCRAAAIAYMVADAMIERLTISEVLEHIAIRTCREDRVVLNAAAKALRDMPAILRKAAAFDKIADDTVALYRSDPFAPYEVHVDGWCRMCQPEEMLTAIEAMLKETP